MKIKTTQTTRNLLLITCSLVLATLALHAPDRIMTSLFTIYALLMIVIVIHRCWGGIGEWLKTTNFLNK